MVASSDVKLPFDNKPLEVAIILLIVGFLLFGISTIARSEPRASVELGGAIVRAPASVLFLNVEWPEAGPGDAAFECGLGLISQYHLKGVTNPNQAALYCALVDGYGKLDVGIGPAFLQNVDVVNGSHFNFTLLLRYRFNARWALTMRHISNAGTVKPNLGRDMLLVSRTFS